MVIEQIWNFLGVQNETMIKAINSVLIVALVSLLLWQASSFNQAYTRIPLLSKLKSKSKENVTQMYNVHPTLLPTTGSAVTLKNDQQRIDDQLNLVEAKEGQKAATLHMFVLVHGFKGAARDLVYLKTQIEKLTSENQLLNNSTSSVAVLAAKCNQGNTDDGVQAGGERLVREIYETIRQEIRRMETNGEIRVTDITLSFVGNSLGGLYSRYAAARIREFSLKERHHLTGSNHTSNEMSMFGRKLLYNVFCSTASPHLGTADHTYIRLPRAIELGIAFALQQTGRDLFRLNHLLRDMATQPYYLDALAAFGKRVAYANAYSTDFMVPTETAAFLNAACKTPHTFLDTQQLLQELQQDESSDQVEFEEHVKHYRDNPLIVAALHTDMTYRPANYTEILTQKQTSMEDDQSQGEVSVKNETDELVQMASALDSLGWKKVFIDLREDMPLRPLKLSLQENGSNLLNIPIPIPLPPLPFSSKRSPSATDMSANNGNGGSKRIMCQRMQRLRNQNIVGSHDLVEVLSAKDKISIPLGHNMIVALNKTTNPIMMAFNQLNQRGRPIMDSLAQELVEDCLRANMNKRPSK